MTTTELFVWAVLLHLVADWVFQTDWMAQNKSNLTSPAGWVHGAIHGFLMLLLFSPIVSLYIAISHVLIDTRVPVKWWQKNVKCAPGNATVTLWLDQVFHLIVLATVCLGGVR